MKLKDFDFSHIVHINDMRTITLCIKVMTKNRSKTFYFPYVLKDRRSSDLTYKDILHFLPSTFLDSEIENSGWDHFGEYTIVLKN